MTSRHRSVVRGWHAWRRSSTGIVLAAVFVGAPRATSLASEDHSRAPEKPAPAAQETSGATPTIEAENAIGEMAYSPDGSTLAVADFRRVTIRDAATGAVRAAFKDIDRHSLAFTPDGRRLIVGGWLNVANVWDVETGQKVATLPDTYWPLCLGVSADGRVMTMARSTGKDVAAVGVVRWDTVDWHELSRFTLPVSRVVRNRSVALSADGATVAVATNDDPTAVTLWDVATAGLNWVLRAPAEPPASRVAALTFRGDGRRIAVAGEDATIRVWNLETEQPAILLRGPSPWARPQRLRFTPDGRFLISSGSGMMKDTIALPPLPYRLDLALSFRLAPLVRRDEFIVWDVGRGRIASRHIEEVSRTRRNGTLHWVPTSAFALSPDGRTLATARPDGTVRLSRLPAE
jgi:WD40 repeat protein